MVQQGQVFQLTRCGPDGELLWAYRYRTGGLALIVLPSARSFLPKLRLAPSSMPIH
jgi:hypothetical protein